MVLSRKKATFLNMIFTAAYQLVTALFGFILPHMLLNTYGAELHGYTSTVNSIMSYIALINAGLAPAAVQALYAPLARKDNQRISEVLNAINRFYVKSGFLYTVAVILCAVVLPFVISNQIPDYLVISLMIAIGATNTLDCFVYSKYRALLQADQRLFVVSMVDTVAYFFRIAVQVFLIKTGCSIVLVMGIPAVLVLARTVVLSYYCKKVFPQLDSKIKPDYSALSKRWSAMIHQLAGMVVYNTDVTLLTIFGSLIEVSIYSVYNLVFGHLYNLIANIFSNGTVASFGQLLHEDKRKSMLRAFDLYEFGYYVIVSFVYGVTASMILPFVSVYTREQVSIPYVDVKLAVLFVLIGFANNMKVPSTTMINAAGHFKETQWRAGLEAVINLSVSLILVKPLGMYGLLIGTVCSFSYRTADIVYYSHKHILFLSCKKTIARIIRVLSCILISVAIYHLLFGKYMINTWLMWILYAVFASIITGFVVLIVHMATDFKTTKECIKFFLKGKKLKLF